MISHLKKIYITCQHADSDSVEVPEQCESSHGGSRGRGVYSNSYGIIDTVVVSPPQMPVPLKHM